MEDNWEIQIDRLENGYILHLNDGEAVRHIAFTVDESPDGLKDGYLEMLAEITEFLGEQGSKHNSLRIKICYQSGDVTAMKLAELEKKTLWDIV